MPPPVGTASNPVGPIEPYEKAFRAIVGYLQGHPNLQSIRSWRSWTGLNDDDVEPTAAQCPWVRLTPIIQPATYLAFDGSSRRAVVPIRINIETAVADTNFGASARVWASLDAALFPVPATDAAGVARLRAALVGVKVSDLTLIQPALPNSLASFGAGKIIGDGAVQLDIEIIL